MSYGVVGSLPQGLRRTNHVHVHSFTSTTPEIEPDTKAEVD